MRSALLVSGMACLSAAIWPAAASAQSEPAAPHEGRSVAIVLTSRFLAGNAVSVRYSEPITEKRVLDVEVGVTLRKRKLPPPGYGPGGSRGNGILAAGYLRWLPKGRSVDGWSGAMKFGGLLLLSEAINADKKRAGWGFVGAPDVLNVTIDRLTDGGYRFGAELGGLTSLAIGSSKSRAVFDSEMDAFPMLSAGAFGTLFTVK
jgi:hypothetical protein